MTRNTRTISLMFTLAALLIAPAHASTVAEMAGHNRVLLVSAPVAADPRLAEQRAALRVWRQGAADRDIAVVEVIGTHVTGADDGYPTLRRRYALPAQRFGVLLIGKDGHVALRDTRPVSGERLAAVIDAMPMRRAGER